MRRARQQHFHQVLLPGAALFAQTLLFQSGEMRLRTNKPAATDCMNKDYILKRKRGDTHVTLGIGIFYIRYSSRYIRIYGHRFSYGRSSQNLVCYLYSPVSGISHFWPKTRLTNVLLMQVEPLKQATPFAEALCSTDIGYNTSKWRDL